MGKKLTARKLTALAYTVTAAGMTAVTALTASPAGASTGPLAKPRIAAHFDLARGQMPENIALEPDGTADVTFAAAEVAAVSTAGTTRVLATLPAPADGGVHTPVLGFALTTGIVRAHDGTLYFLVRHRHFGPDRPVATAPGDQRIAALPADGVERAGPGRTPRQALRRRLRTGRSTPSPRRARPAANRPPGSRRPRTHRDRLPRRQRSEDPRQRAGRPTSIRGTVLRIPFGPGGGGPGAVRIRATDLTGIDDFAFTGRGDEVPGRAQRPQHGRPHPPRRQLVARAHRRRRPAEPDLRRAAPRHAYSAPPTPRPPTPQPRRAPPRSEGAGSSPSPPTSSPALPLVVEGHDDLLRRTRRQREREGVLGVTEGNAVARQLGEAFVVLDEFGVTSKISVG